MSRSLIGRIWPALEKKKFQPGKLSTHAYIFLVLYLIFIYFFPFLPLL